MKPTFCTLLILALLLPAKTETKQKQPTIANDELILTQQFLRWFFPQIAGRNADAQFRTDMPLFFARPNHDEDWTRPRPLTFDIVDWCEVEHQPGMPQILPHPPYPCTEKYKDYQRPLWGQLGFIRRNGRTVLNEAILHGALLDTAESGWPVKSCHLKKPANTKDIIERLQLRHLSLLLGGGVKVLEVNGFPGTSGRMGELGWNAHLEVSQPRSSVRYFFSLDDCGSILMLSPLGW